MIQLRKENQPPTITTLWWDPNLPLLLCKALPKFQGDAIFFMFFPCCIPCYWEGGGGGGSHDPHKLLFMGEWGGHKRRYKVRKVVEQVPILCVEVS